MTQKKPDNTIWPYGILKDLGLQGRLPSFIKHFLEDQTFQTQINNTLSDPKPQEIGVPQGSILSVSLFMIKTSKITTCLPPEINRSLYFDDFLVCYCSKNMVTIERKMQQCIKILKWTMKNGLKSSSNKTKCMHFCQIHKMHNQPTLTLNGSEISITQQYKFLGITLDPKLSFIPLIKQLRIKCNQTIQLLRIITHTDWGADKEEKKKLPKLYRCLIWSKLDFSCIIYGAVRKTRNYPSPGTPYCPRSLHYLFKWKFIHRSQ